MQKLIEQVRRLRIEGFLDKDIFVFIIDEFRETPILKIHELTKLCIENKLCVDSAKDTSELISQFLVISDTEYLNKLKESFTRLIYELSFEDSLFGEIKPKAEVIETNKLVKPERKRTYYYPVDGHVYTVELENVIEVCVRPSGSHRIKTADGKFHIINPGWLNIELDIDEWSF